MDWGKDAEYIGDLELTNYETVTNGTFTNIIDHFNSGALPLN